MTGPFDRAWSRRPFVSPPRWAPVLAVSPLWLETLVQFQRGSRVETPGGGFDDLSPATYLTAYCHVEIDYVQDIASSASTTVSDAPGFSHWWALFLPSVIEDVALDPAVYPRKGDRVVFTADDGTVVSKTLRDVTSPDTILDHFECATETWR